MSLDDVISKDMLCHENDQIFSELKKSFGITNDSIVNMYNFYDADVYGYGNEVYDNLPIRFVQYLHARKYGSWHQDKNKFTSFWLSDYWPCNIADIGFGIPHSYILNRICDLDPNASILLAEKFPCAINFAKELIRIYSSKVQTVKIEYIKFDMDTSSFEDLRGKDVYIMLDVLEHALKPEKVLAEVIDISHSNSKFILSLPVGEQVPVHNISWDSKEGIIDWLDDNGMKPIREKILAPNPKVDVFIDSMNDDFFNLLIECEKS